MNGSDNEERAACVRRLSPACFSCQRVGGVRVSWYRNKGENESIRVTKQPSRERYARGLIFSRPRIYIPRVGAHSRRRKRSTEYRGFHVTTDASSPRARIVSFLIGVNSKRLSTCLSLPSSLYLSLSRLRSMQQHHIIAIITSERVSDLGQSDIY